MLNNLTVEDADVYTCIARATVSNQNDTIELKVMQPIIEGNYQAYNVSLPQYHIMYVTTTCNKIPLSSLVKFVVVAYKFFKTMNRSKQEGGYPSS